MSADRGDVLLPEDVNPFPPTSVAPVLEFGAATITIETPAVRTAITSLEAYMAAGRGGTEAIPNSHAGNVVSVLGDYGTGKTHLAMYLLWRAGRAGDHSVYTMYVDAPADTFAALYRERFVPKLKRSDVYGRVRSSYAEIVAKSLDDTGFATEIPRMLRKGDVDPRQVVWQMGMMESRFLQSLRRKLQQVTRNEAFGTALALLLRPEFESAVWEWFSGHPPDKILQERGITTAIEGDSDALEAIGVFAMLYGSENHKFVLVIDELEKILSASNRPDSSAVIGFKKLLTVASESGAFLVLSGLPEFLQPLGADVVQRIGLVVHTSPLRTEDVIHYIENRMEQAFGERRLAPFSPDVVDYLAGLAGGNARRIMQLCHRAYQQASAGKTAVTEAMIRAAAREQFEVLTIDDLRAEIARILDTRGWPFSSNYVHGEAGKPRVDYWIPVGEAGAGCAVLLSESVLYPEEVTSITDRVRAIAAEVPASGTLLVINGYLAPRLSDAIRDVLTAGPLIYDALRFADDFYAALLGVTHRLEKVTHEDSLVIIRDRLERLGQMQSHTQNFVEQLAAYLDAMRALYDRRLGAIQRGLEGVSKLPVPAAPGEKETAGPGWQIARQLPPKVEQLFTSARDSVATLDPNSLLRSMFTVENDAATVRARKGLVQRLQSSDAFQSVGLATLLHGLVDAFQAEVEEWYSQVRTRPDQLSAADREELTFLCRTYDAIYEYLPLFRLDDLSQLTVGIPGRADSIDHATRSSRSADIREALDGLGARVHDAMRRSLALG